MLTLYNGRPENCADRLDKEIRCYDFLDSLGVVYQRLDHDHADTMEICAQIEESLGAMICKNLFLTNRQESEFYLLMMPADKIFKTKFLSKALGVSRLSFASPEHMLELLDIAPGSVSVLGLMNDKDKKVHLVIDRDILTEKYIGCHPCINTSSLRFKTNDLLETVIPALEHNPTFVELQTEE